MEVGTASLYKIRIENFGIPVFDRIATFQLEVEIKIL
jgi:hypothetical protein